MHLGTYDLTTITGLALLYVPISVPVYDPFVHISKSAEVEFGRNSLLTTARSLHVELTIFSYPAWCLELVACTNKL